MKKIKRMVRSIRANEELLKKAKDHKIVISTFLEKQLEKYFNGETTCPCCGQTCKNEQP